MPARQLRIDGVKLCGKIPAKIARGLHAGQDNADTLFSQSDKDRLQVGVGFCGRQATQSIIAAKLNQNEMRFVSEGPVQAGQPAGSRVTGNPSIDNPDIVTGGIKSFFQLRRKRIFRFHRFSSIEPCAS